MKKIILLILLNSAVTFAEELPRVCKTPAAPEAKVVKSKCTVGICEIVHVYGETAKALYAQTKEDETHLNPDKYATFPFNTYPFIIKSSGEQLQCFQATLKSCSYYECELWLNQPR